MATFDIAAFIAEAQSDKRQYDEAVARLTPSQRREWLDIYESYEYFDGEYAIALGALKRAKADGSLDR